MLSAAALASTAGAATFTEFPLGEEHRPFLMKAGPDGNLWFTDRGFEGGIGKISPSGEIFPEIGNTTTANDLVFAPDGTLYWVTDSGLGRRMTGGFVSEVAGNPEGSAITASSAGLLYWNKVTSASFVCNGVPFEGGGGAGCSGWGESGKYTGFAFDGAGDLWAVSPKSNAVRRASGPQAGTLVELPAKSEPHRIALGPDGNLWVTIFGAGAIDRVTTAGQRQRFPLPAGSKPNEIVAGPDGAMWFTEFGTGRIGRITTGGEVTEYLIPTPAAEPIGLAFGPEGNLFFTEGVGKIGRLVPDPLVNPGGGGTGSGGGGGASAADSGDHVPPGFTANPSFVPARFAVAGAAKASAARHRAVGGSKLGVSLSEAATVTAAVSRSLPGRRKGGRCVAPASATKGAARCKRLVGVGTQSWSAVAGASKLPFTGKLDGKALKPGAYSASLVARDAAGNASAPKVATFTIVAG
jgi:virginiamycin B lyase